MTRAGELQEAAEESVRDRVPVTGGCAVEYGAIVHNSGTSMEAIGRPLREEKPFRQAVHAKEVLCLKTLSEQVEAVGAPVSEEDLVITLLCRLPGSYDVLITALESRSDALTWRFVTSRLLHEETKRKEQGNDGMKSAAFLTRQEKMKRFPCKICGQMGHWTNKCDRRGEKKQSVAAMAKEESDYLFMASGVEESASSG
ncbi:hypothetical protein LEN26_017070 [Aphanomyces euteiches]|nr:hypothetical protein LEN26_017070 [Aphanomyces euteiches]KAH9111982.1 hypothetical protein AeMF1_013602 [Aphanomyces euteiches]